MKLSKAIELSKEAEDSLRTHKFPDHADAIKLTREAAIRVSEGRTGYETYSPDLLPGEDPE